MYLYLWNDGLPGVNFRQGDAVLKCSPLECETAGIHAVGRCKGWSEVIDDLLFPFSTISKPSHTRSAVSCCFRNANACLLLIIIKPHPGLTLDWVEESSYSFPLNYAKPVSEKDRPVVERCSKRKATENQCYTWWSFNKYVTLDHKTSLKSLEYICNNSQKYIVWVKIIDFPFMPKNH